MNKFLAVFFLFAFVVTAGFAQAPAKIQSPSQPKILLDDGTIVGPANPMPVTPTSTIGTATIDPNTPPSRNLMTAVSVTNTAANVTSLINRKSFAIFNHSTSETLWASLDASCASATVDASIPIPPLGYISDELDSGKTIALVASTSIKATVYQAGY
jgi:hypothetical protein